MGVRLIMGESGGLYNSGHDGLSNRFVDSFWYLKSMATLAQNRHNLHCRQSLLGGYYELVHYDPSKNTMTPNPSYFAALLFSKLMGRQVWKTQVDGSDNGLHQVFAHCQQQQQQLTLLVLNYSPNTTATI